MLGSPPITQARGALLVATTSWLPKTVPTAVGASYDADELGALLELERRVPDIAGTASWVWYANG